MVDFLVMAGLVPAIHVLAPVLEVLMPGQAGRDENGR
jgi:hypothetical protein